MNIKAEVEYTVERVAVMLTFATGHARSKSPTKDFVDPGSLGEFVVNFSVIERECIYHTGRARLH
jgi:hypothetical protein